MLLAKVKTVSVNSSVYCIAVSTMTLSMVFTVYSPDEKFYHLAGPQLFPMRIAGLLPIRLLRANRRKLYSQRHRRRICRRHAELSALFPMLIFWFAYECLRECRGRHPGRMRSYLYESRFRFFSHIPP